MSFILRHPTCISVSFYRKKDTCIRMLKNISNNVKCVKVQYAKILLSTASPFFLPYLDCHESMNMSMGTIQQPYSLKSTSLYIPNE